MRTSAGSFFGNEKLSDDSPMRSHLPQEGMLSVYIFDPFEEVYIPVGDDCGNLEEAKERATITAQEKSENVTVLNSRGEFVFSAYNGW